MAFAERMRAELALIQRYFPGTDYSTERGHWVRIANYRLPEGWSIPVVGIPFEVKESHPGTPPYGLYVPAGLTFKGVVPNNRNANAAPPPFPGEWALLSWAPADGVWRATADLLTGSNLLHWVRGFADRFAEGA